jgi:hypothetical protein
MLEHQNAKIKIVVFLRTGKVDVSVFAMGEALLY